MSAEIGSVEPITADVSVLEAAAVGVGALKIESHEKNLPADEVDAADFLLSNSKYHDCFLTVGNPECEKVESIGVTSVDLIAHSAVLRKMLENYKQADLPQAEVNITDVSPATFKLMLRYVYGGKLPQMTAIEAAGLALCADKFKIPRLVQKALKRLHPTSAEDVFPALICVTYINFPDLNLKVTKIIQQETDKIVKNSDFVELDEDCVIFILKQDTLNIGELELWKSVIRWAEHQVVLNPNRTTRDCLMKIFGYVRFLTLTLEDIAEHVLPTQIITSEEFVALTLALTKKQTLESPLLCKIKEGRVFYKEENVIAISANVGARNKTRDDNSLLQCKSETVFGEACVFKIVNHYNCIGLAKPQRVSTLSIKPSEPIEIVSFTCHPFLKEKHIYSHKICCDITVNKRVEDIVVSAEEISFEDYFNVNQYVVLPIKLKSGLPLVVNAEETCTFTLRFSHHINAYNLMLSNGFVYPLGSAPPLHRDNITFTNNLSSVLQIHYKK